MPNWSSNRLYVKGNPAEVKKFTDTLGTNDADDKPCDFSFHQTVPMPSILRHTTSGSQGELGYAMLTDKVLNPFGKLDEYKERFNALSDSEKEAVLEEGRAYKLNMDTHGATNWYDWSIANWGTKWDACDVDCDVDGIKELVANAIKDGDDEVTIDIGFDTAWAPPTDWMKRVATMFPELEFQIAFSECGMDFYGVATACGEDYSEDCAEGGCEWEEDEDECHRPSGKYADFLEFHSIHSGG